MWKLLGKFCLRSGGTASPTQHPLKNSIRYTSDRILSCTLGLKLLEFRLYPNCQTRSPCWETVWPPCGVCYPIFLGSDWQASVGVFKNICLQAAAYIRSLQHQERGVTNLVHHFHIKSMGFKNLPYSLSLPRHSKEVGRYLVFFLQRRNCKPSISVIGA